MSIEGMSELPRPSFSNTRPFVLAYDEILNYLAVVFMWVSYWSLRDTVFNIKGSLGRLSDLTFITISSDTQIEKCWAILGALTLLKISKTFQLCYLKIPTKRDLRNLSDWKQTPSFSSFSQLWRSWRQGPSHSGQY